MSELYFIGGVSLCGKAEVAKAFLGTAMPRSEKAIQYTSTDAIRSQAWDNIPDDEEPTLAQMHKDRRTETEEEWIHRSKMNPSYSVDRQHREAEVIWRRGILPHLRPNINRGLPTLIEGVHVLPQLLTTFNKPHRAVFVGSNADELSDEHFQNVLRTARELPDHYMKHWSERKIRTYMAYVMPAYSARLRDLCAKYGYRYFDLSHGDYRATWHGAGEYLLHTAPATGAASAG